MTNHQDKVQDARFTLIAVSMVIISNLATLLLVLGFIALVLNKEVN